MNGKLIVIEGVDCSGKETQSKLLETYFLKKGVKVARYSFPNYDSPTGRIFGACYLGKKELCEKYLIGLDGFFLEGASVVDPYVASLYVAADRKYNIAPIKRRLEEGYVVILDRYVYSNMAYQGGKIDDFEERSKFYHSMEVLEFDLLGLPKPELVIFLYLPFQYVMGLRENRKEVADQHERDDEYLKRVEESYLELLSQYGFCRVDGVEDGVLLQPEEVHKRLVRTINRFYEK